MMKKNSSTQREITIQVQGEEKEVMSLKPEPIGPIPQETARVAQAACPKGSTFIKMRDTLGVLFQNEMFADLFPNDGQPALARLSIGLGDHHAIRRRVI